MLRFSATFTKAVINFIAIFKGENVDISLTDAKFSNLRSREIKNKTICSASNRKDTAATNDNNNKTTANIY